MFGVDTTELLIVALAALIFIGPKELPGAMRTVGRFVGRVRAHARHFTAGIENMMREAELEEMEKRWREENERIMREHPVALPYPGASVGGEPNPFVPSEARPEPVEVVEAPAGGTTGPSTSLGANGGGSGDRSTNLTGSGQASHGASRDATEEPPLPFPEPDHQRRELP